MEMTTTFVKIDSDVTNRFKRIMNQVEFDGQLTFITELLQNCQKGKATKVDVTLYGDKLIVCDNGIGCADPKDLFTLDTSGFEQGFGEGFSSVYTLLGRVKVKTLDWEAEVDVANLASKRVIKKEDLHVPIYKSYFYQGFIVELVSEKIGANEEEIKQMIRKVSSTMLDIDFTINGETLSKHDLFKAPEHHHFYELFDNSMYTGMLYVDTLHEYKGVDVYYEDRFVQNIHQGLGGLSGNIVVKKNKISLKAPDRTSIIRDEKRALLLKHLKRNLVTLLIYVLKEGSLDEVGAYSNVIQQHIPIEKSARFLRVNESEIKNQYEAKQTASDIPLIKKERKQGRFPLTFDKIGRRGSIKTMTSPPKAKVKGLDISTKNVKPKKGRQQSDRSFASYVSPPRPKRDGDSNLVSLSVLKKKTNVVWVELSRVKEFSEMIAEYEYYGIFTFISQNKLYDEALEYLGITHIEQVEENAIEKDYSVRNTGAKNKKEQRVMEILEKIESFFGLKETFYLSDIDCKMTVRLNDKKLHQQKLEIKGYAQGDVIHLNRKSLEFGKITGTMIGKKQLGVHDLKFILANLVLISHELSHFYGGNDNTLEQYHIQDSIQNKIGEFILNAEIV